MPDDPQTSDDDVIRRTIDRTIEREGGFVDHPDDPGGATNMGITRRTLSDWLGREATIEEVRELDRETARAIYRQRYLVDTRIIEIQDPWLRSVVFDATVLWWTDQSIVWLQAAVLEKTDGILGPKTLAAVNRDDPRHVGRAFLMFWACEHGDRVQRGDAPASMIGGWIRRVCSHLAIMPIPYEPRGETG